MEIIYPILFFIVPGMIIKTIYNTIEKPKRQKVHLYEYLSEVVIDSTIVLFLSAIAYNTLTLNDLIEKLDDIIFLANFIAFQVVMSLMWYYIKYEFLVKIIYYVLNRAKAKQNLKYEDSRTVWEKFLANDEIMGSWFVISIYRDQTLITTGMVDTMNCPEIEEFELHLTHTKKCEELMKHDKDAFLIVDEYYNIDKGLRIIFYDDKKIQKHWHEYFNE